MTKDLNQIISEAYTLFAKYPAPQELDICTDCCVTKNEESELISMAVEHIPFELLYTYNTAAKTPKPSITEFKHFLPRFLELTAEFKFVSHSAALALSRFDYYEQNEWLENEVEIIQQFGEVFFFKCLAQYPIPDLERIDDMLIMLQNAHVDVSTLLEIWMNSETIESVLHFKDLCLHGFKQRKPDVLNNGFANESLSNLLSAWREDVETKKHFAQRIEGIMMQSTKVDEAELCELSWLYETL